MTSVVESVEPHDRERAEPTRSSRRYSTIGFFVMVTLLLAFSGTLSGWYIGRLQAPQPLGILPGEFERHDALVIAQRTDFLAAYQDVILQVSDAVSGNLQLILVVPDAATQQQFTELLQQRGISDKSYRFVKMPIDTEWIRDYGPLVTKSFDRGYRIVDMDYAVPVYNPRFADESIPKAFSDLLKLDYSHAPIYLDGGNLLSNGAGLCITTDMVLERNEMMYGYTEERVSELIRKHFGAEQVIYLQGLDGELTGHVDMFATFTGPDAIVIGKYHRQHDHANADILDQNAQQLENVITACGPLQVHRVTMPPPTRDEFARLWLTYTNVVYANGVALVPVYGDYDKNGQEAAIALYQKLLPGWKIVGIDCMQVAKKRGSLHCLTLNLFRLDARDD